MMIPSTTTIHTHTILTTTIFHINITDWMERVIVPGDRIIAVLKMDGPHVVMIILRNVQNEDQCVMIMTEIWGRVIVPGDRIIAVLKMDGPHVVMISLRNVQNEDQCVMIMTEIWGRVIVPGDR